MHKDPPFRLPLRYSNIPTFAGKKKILDGGGVLQVSCAVSRTHLSPALRLRCAPHPSARVELARLWSLGHPVCLGDPMTRLLTSLYQ